MFKITYTYSNGAKSINPKKFETREIAETTAKNYIKMQKNSVGQRNPKLNSAGKTTYTITEW